MIRAAVLAIVLQGALASGAYAQAQTQPEGVGYFAGRWHVVSRDPDGANPIEVSYAIEPTAGGAWLTGQAASKDGSLSSRDMWGRDPLTGELIRVIFDKSGTRGEVRSKGWEGDKLVLEGEARSKGGTVRVRETITRKGPQRFDAIWEAHRDGKWTPYAVEVVTRRT
ncbi:hypothetical protein [Phenylobacterium sp.]|jgi:hypothetical protein|uniref:hypothetical protein n=1 Tax=Phenylobacterium sp. TaxID=1871053 RepID=UPI002F92021E